ncbi:MAG: GIY-YIG nuclease family protein [Bacteroides sp.]|nr:GIY-YIG nuclease family protein [Bacteroides sp.]
MKSSSLETLIHRLFASVRFQAVIDGHRPKEWFVVALKVIEEGIKAVVFHQSVRYLPDLKQLVYLLKGRGRRHESDVRSLLFGGAAFQAAVRFES